MHAGDGLYLGNAQTGILAQLVPGLPPNGGRGAGPLGMIYAHDILPLTIQTNNIAASQTPGAAGNLVLTAGTGITSVVNARGETVLQFDVPRNVRITSAADDSGKTFTVTGYDFYGVKMSEAITGPNTTITNAAKKAFFQILTVAISAAAAGAILVGTGDKFGLPYAVTDAVYIARAGWNATLAENAGTFVAADATTATTTTGDVRGTFLPSSASDGVKRLVLAFIVPTSVLGFAAAGVTAAVGVAQNLSTS